MTKNQCELEKMFDEYYPRNGGWVSLAAEILNAAMEISFNAYKYGDMIGVGYGRETCNPSARFLMSNTTEEIANLIIAIWGLENGGAYCALFNVIIGKVIEYVKEHPEIRDMGTEGIMSCKDPIEDTNEYDLRDACNDFGDYDDYDDYPSTADEILAALNANLENEPKEHQDLLELDKRICMDESVQG